MTNVYHVFFNLTKMRKSPKYVQIAKKFVFLHKHIYLETKKYLISMKAFFFKLLFNEWNINILKTFKTFVASKRRKV